MGSQDNAPHKQVIAGLANIIELPPVNSNHMLLAG